MRDENYNHEKMIYFKEDFLKKQKEKIYLRLEARLPVSRLWIVPAFSAGLLMLVFFLKSGSNEKPLPGDLAFYRSIDMLEDFEVLEEVSEEELK